MSAAAERPILICYDGSPEAERAVAAVVALADSIDASVVVVGSRGLSAAGELLEGSPSHALAVHSGRPVLIVPPPHG